MNIRFALTILCLLISFSAFAGTLNQLELSGNVNADCNLNVVADSKAEKLDILGGEAPHFIAKVTEMCNKRDGYTVSMRSLHGDKLINAAAPQAFTSYTLSYDGSDFVAPGTLAHHIVKTVSSPGKKKVDHSDVYINIIPYPDALEGIYTDTVTFTITAL